MRFSAIALAVAFVEARDPKLPEKPTPIADLKKMKPDFAYPKLNEIGTPDAEKQGEEKHVIHPPKYIFDPAWYAPRYGYYPSPHVYIPHYPHDATWPPKPAPKPKAKKVYIPVCPTYTQWLNPRYLAKLHKKALKERYIFARNRCSKKHWSPRKRYNCFRNHWIEFVPGQPNSLHDIRSRVQSDCMRYRDHPVLRKQCFEAHVNHYKDLILDEKRLLAEAE